MYSQVVSRATTFDALQRKLVILLFLFLVGVEKNSSVLSSSAYFYQAFLGSSRIVIILARVSGQNVPVVLASRISV